MSVGYKGKVAMSAGAINAPYKPAPDTWQSYLHRLGNGLNGVIGAGGTNTFTEADIVANAYKWMQMKYPGNYRVEQFYNADKMKWDLRLRFEDAQEETMWLLRWA